MALAHPELPDPTAARAIGRALLQIGAVRFSPDAPFTWSSGIRSPIYCDNRLTLSYPEVRNLIRQAFVGRIQAHYPEARALAGVATGAIAMGMLVADTLGLPYLYVRPKAKDHGLGNQVEGRIDPHTPTVVIEDLVSTGGSSLEAVRALRHERADVLGLIAIFTYGFEHTWKAFAQEGLTLTPLCDLATLLEVAETDGLLVPSVIASIRAWGQDPEGWQG
ncbi:MAG: orotate phosphoribosyltransferase [Bacteroidia bacterium]|nr:orotate phosphoribosyltransferase [Bacteroidia bacterium]